METDGLRRIHLRDQAAAALDEVTGAERRAARENAYPLWFWLVSGLGFAAFPASTAAGTARDAVALIGGAVILVALLAVSRGRRSRERCRTLGFRGWLREVAVFGPALGVIVAAVAVSDGADWAVTGPACAVVVAVWVAAGALTGRVSAR